jgi:hypothetical protein
MQVVEVVVESQVTQEVAVVVAVLAEVDRGQAQAEPQELQVQQIPVAAVEVADMTAQMFTVPVVETAAQV